VCSKNDEPLKIVDNKGYTLNQVDIFKYLRSHVNTKRFGEDFKRRTAVAWQKLKELAGVVCDRKMPTRVNGTSRSGQ